MKSFFILFFCVSAISASAATTQCASSDSRLHYTYSQTDGGAFIGPSWSLAVDGKTLIAHSPFGGAEIRMADLAWVGETKAVKKTTSAKYETVYYLRDAKVTTKIAAGSILFQDTVFCQAQRYIGPPLP